MITAYKNFNNRELKSENDTKLKVYINDKGFYKLNEKYLLPANGLGIAVADIDKNGYEDVLVANDFSIHDYLFMNFYGDFRESFEEKFSKSSWYSMGCDIQDFDNDSDLDLMVLDMAYSDYYRSKVLMPSMDVDKFNFYKDRIIKNY